MAANASQQDPWLYVGGDDGNVVMIYDVSDIADKSATLIGQITGVSGPDGLSLDSLGNLYVSSPGTNTVLVYPPGSTTPSLTLSKGLGGPIDVAVDPKGNVYVLNATKPSITMFPAGKTKPSATITSALLPKPTSMAFDGAGDLMVSDYKRGVSEIPAGSNVPKSLHLYHAHRAFTLTVDPTTEDLYAYTSSSFRYIIQAWHPKSRTSYMTYGGYDLNASYLALGTVGDQEYMFETYSGRYLLAYVVGQSPLLTYLTEQGQGLNGLAFKPAGVP